MAPRIDFKSAAVLSRLQKIAEDLEANLPPFYQSELTASYLSRDLPDLSALRMKRALIALYRQQYQAPPDAPVLSSPLLNNPVGDEFRRQVAWARDRLPPYLRRLMDEFGIATHLARRLTDIDEQYAAQPLMTKGTYEFNAAALYSAHNLKITMLLEMPQKDKPGSYRLIRHVPAKYFHEAGHALDDLLSDFSSNPDFRDAYEQDASELTRQFPRAHFHTAYKYYNYYLTTRQGGLQTSALNACKETFAEIFANLMEQQHMMRPRPLRLEPLFPRTTKLVKTALQATAFEVKTFSGNAPSLNFSPL